MTTPARLERRRFADLLAEVGPDAPTLCEGWTTRDLAAHVIVREHRPDAALGLVVGKLAGRTKRVQDSVASREWSELVDAVRDGPPRWAPTRIDRVDRLVNTTEFFVHQEDVRRAADDWEPRAVDDELVDDLEVALRRSAPMLARKAPAGLVLEPDGGRARVVAKDGTPSAIVRGPVTELVMWMSGRQDHARVTCDGPEDLVEAFRTASFGI